MTDSLFDLEGHVALITGGNSGIGLGMAEGLARCGADVCIWGTNPDKNATAEAALTPYGRRVMTRRVDVGDEAQVVDGVAEVVSTLGRLDSCFANAAVAGGHKNPRFVDSTLAEWRAVMRVNLDGAYVTLREAARQMIARGTGGSLVGTASIAVQFGSPREEAYAASKAGVVALIRSLAVELARHKIRANALLPGWTISPMMEPWAAQEAVVDKVLSRIPLQRWRASRWRPRPRAVRRDAVRRPGRRRRTRRARRHAHVESGRRSIAVDHKQPARARGGAALDRAG